VSPFSARAFFAAAVILVPVSASEARAECPDGRVASVFVDNHSVFDLTDPARNGQFAWAFRLANRMHVRTREDVILRELLFQRGDCYDPVRLEESARQLRAAGFIADADVYGIRQPDGNWHIVVDTRDEWSTRVDLRLDSREGSGITGFRFTEENVLGSGRSVSAFSLRSQGERVYGATYFTPQLFDSRWTAESSVGRTPTGALVSLAVLRPFLGEGGGWAARQHLRYHDRYFQYLAPVDGGLVRVLLPEERRRLELGAMRRFGRPGGLTILGAGLVGDWSRFGEPFAEEAGQDIEGFDPRETVVGLDSLGSVRFEIVAGKRNVRFLRTRGVNSLRGSEDIPVGAEMEIGIGRSLVFLSTSDDLSLHLGSYFAGGLPRGALGGLRSTLEGRRDYDAPADEPEWRDLLGHLEAWVFWRPSEDSRHSWIGAVTAAGGWRTVLPFQLTLGSDAGLRGYPRVVHPAGRRVVSTLEWRTAMGSPFSGLMDLGTAAFVDVGRAWAGGAPFGTDSPTLVDAGVGVRVAFPPGARTTYRLDLAVPLEGDGRFNSLRIAVGLDRSVMVGRRADDPQLLRSLRRGVTASLFNYPH
jgi:hypothetical protein